MAKKADPHRAFVAAWKEYGERWLTRDVDLVGSRDAWFKVCTSTRWWDDERLPPERPAHPREVKRKAKRSKRRAPVPFGVPIPGRLAELVGWPWTPHERLAWWERWHADPKVLGLDPEPLLWWEADEWEKEDWPLAV